MRSYVWIGSMIKTIVQKMKAARIGVRKRESMCVGEREKSIIKHGQAGRKKGSHSDVKKQGKKRGGEDEEEGGWETRTK